jgi:SAM-dependent methyltransferase
MTLEKYKQVIGEDFGRDADFMDKAIKDLDLDKNSKILDIGTGFGAMSILLALNGFEVLTGQPEHDEEWDELAEYHHNHSGSHDHHHSFEIGDWRKNAKVLGVEEKIKFQYLDALNLEFDDETFDGIFMYDSLQHIKNRKDALNESMRIIKNNGLICVIEWNMRSIKETEEKEGFTIDYVDPGEILDRKDISCEMIKGDYINIFILRKNSI